MLGLELLGNAGCGVHGLLASRAGTLVLPADGADIAVCIRKAGIHILTDGVVVYTRAQANKQKVKSLALFKSLYY